MSDYLPFEIQDKILKLLPVRSLIRFRSVSKTWKSWIDTSDFVNTYTRHIHHHRLLVRYAPPVVIDNNNNNNLTQYKHTFISIADDHTFPLNILALDTPPRYFPNDHEYHEVIGCSHGLVCFYVVAASVVGLNRLVIWNPSIRRAIEIHVSNGTTIYNSVFGFGVCPLTSHPKIVRISYRHLTNDHPVPFQAELFTLTTRAWRSVTGSSLPRASVNFRTGTDTNCPVATDGFVYWIASDTNGWLIVSFDIAREEFGEVNLPDGLAQSQHALSISKISDSVAVLEEVEEDEEPGATVFNVWIMEGGTGVFTQLYTVNVDTPKQAWVMGFRQTGDAVIKITKSYDGELVGYERISKQMNHLGLDGAGISFFVHPHMETLLLHDFSDLTIRPEAVQGSLV